MLDALRANVDTEGVAGTLGRTPRAIMCRQQIVAARQVREGSTLDAAAAFASLSLEEARLGIEKYTTLLGGPPPGNTTLGGPPPGGCDTSTKQSNSGKRWTPEDDVALLAAASAGRDRVEYATVVGRSGGAVLGRLQSLALVSVAGGATIEEAALATGLPPSFVAEGVAKAAKAVKAAAKPPLAPIVRTDTKVRTTVPATDPTEEQRNALSAVRTGRDVLITGPAGTGKSFTVQLILDWARGAGKDAAVTATTGAAAALVGGRTLHAFLGIGTGSRPLSDLVWQARYRAKNALARVLAMDVLVIDEVSMLGDELFDKVIAYITTLRGPGRPFQLILTGDFCQLPPVEGAFAFKAASWIRRAPTVVQLTRLLRQDGDAPFQAMLMRLRWSNVTPEDLATLRALRNTTFPAGIEPTRLFALNAQVDRVNSEAISALLAAGAASRTYTRQARGEDAKRWADAVGVPDRIVLAVGAQVMVTRNLQDQGLYNGMRGVVVALLPDAVAIRRIDGTCFTLQRVSIACETEPTLAAMAIPLRLAYAISIHKSQGVTLDALEVDLGRSVFEAGQAYVALSRARNIASVRVLDVDPGAFRVHPEVVSFYGHINVI